MRRLASGRAPTARAPSTAPHRPISSAARRPRQSPEGGTMTARVTRDIIESYLSCTYKAHLKLAGQQGTKSDYELLLAQAREEATKRATGGIVARYTADGVEQDIPLTTAALMRGAAFLLNVTLEDDALSVAFDG